MNKLQIKEMLYSALEEFENGNYPQLKRILVAVHTGISDLEGEEDDEDEPVCSFCLTTDCHGSCISGLDN